MADMNLRLPLVVILGATGSGKTKLSLNLAQRFAGEIVGADSMQIYKNLDIISAKATSEERSVVPHHLIDLLDSNELCTVLDYRNKAIPIIDDIFERKKIPIIAGGTNYYIESILWKILIDEPGSGRKAEPGICPNKYHELPSEQLHEKLKILDPDMAKRLHPNNKRKILRALEVYQQKGRTLSNILQEQQSSLGGNSLGGGLRYSNTLIFWLQWNQDILDERINERVDGMVAEGLVSELLRFHKDYNEKRLKNESKPDYTKGIFQMIGFKEFHEYLILDDEQREAQEGKAKLEEGISNLKMVTRRYARKQNRWIRNRFLGRQDREVPPVYGLSTEDLTKWDEDITRPATEIIESFIKGNTCPYEKLPPVNVKSMPNSKETSFFCETCKRVFIGEFQWNIHVKSNKHKRAVIRLNKTIKEDSQTNVNT